MKRLLPMFWVIMESSNCSKRDENKVNTAGIGSCCINQGWIPQSCPERNYIQLLLITSTLQSCCFQGKIKILYRVFKNYDRMLNVLESLYFLCMYKCIFLIARNRNNSIESGKLLYYFLNFIVDLSIGS